MVTSFVFITLCASDIFEERKTYGIQPSFAQAEEERLKIDNFPKDLEEREAWYRKKNGEDWGWLKFRDRRGEKLILSPGDWGIEQSCGAGLGRVSVFLSDLDGPSLSASFDSRMYHGIVIAPNGTDLFAYGMACIYHYNVNTGQAQLIGTPYRPGHRDGPAEQALLGMRPTSNNGQIAMDYSSGRIYFRAGVHKKDFRIRYVKRRKDGTYWVDTIPNFNQGLGQYLFVSLDGQYLYLIRHDNKVTKINQIDIGTGRIVSSKKVKYGDYVLVKKNWHTSMEMGTDGYIYLGSGGECGGNAMSLYKIDPLSGQATKVFDTYRGPNGQMDTRKDREWYKAILGGLVEADGPVGNPYLFCRSTSDITYCPRSGAIYFAGWDGYGIRRYLDGYLTTLISPFGDHTKPKNFQGLRHGLGTAVNGLIDFVHGSNSIGIAPNGDIYMNAQGAVMRIFRRDWPFSEKGRK